MRKETARMAACVLSAALAVTGVSVPGNSAQAAAKPKLSATSATLYKGAGAAKKSTTLKLKVGGKKVNATWKSNKTSVAKVSKAGKVTAKKAGKANITATYKGKTYTCKVTVKKYKAVTGLTISPKTITLAAGKTKKLAVTVTPKKATETGVTYSSSDSSVATVNKNGKITAKAAGKATIKIKTVGVKANGNVMSKNVTVVVTDDSTVEPTEAPTAAPDETAAPTDAPSAEPTVEPSLAPDVVGVPETITGEVTNPIDETEAHQDVVMANKTATVKFLVADKDGKPVKNETVTVTQVSYPVHKDNDGVNRFPLVSSKDNDRHGEYKLEGDKNVEVVKTDDSGIARVTLAPQEDLEVLAKNYDDFSLEDAVASYRLTAVCASDEKVTKQLNVRVAAVTYQAINNNATTGKSVMETTDDKNKIAGTNAAGIEAATRSVTHDASDVAVDYVSSQQVNAAGATNHDVGFRTNVNLVLPAYPDDRTGASTTVQDVNMQSGKYHPYNNTSAQSRIPVNNHYWYDTNSKDIEFNTAALEDVEYATLTFNKIDLSAYSQLLVKLVNADGSDGDVLNTYGGTNKSYTVTDQSLQIPYEKLKTSKGLRIRIKNWGQVDANHNTGYDIKDLTWVYKSKSGVGTTYEEIEGVTIKWEQVTPKWSTEKTLLSSDIANYSDIVNAGETATYKMPVFPYVGNAIIAVKNSKGNVVGYYAVPAVNKTTNVDKVGAVYANENIIQGSDSAVAADKKKAYLITEEEAKVLDATVVKLSDDGKGNVTVGTEKSGMVFLKGSIENAGNDKNVILDDLTNSVYTSVMWNPIPDALQDNMGFVAIEGQTVTVKAQLVDANNNLMRKSGVGVSFHHDDDADQPIASNRRIGNSPNYKLNGNDDLYGAIDNKADEEYSISYTDNYAEITALDSTVTDVNGCVELKLKGVGLVDVIGLRATCDDSQYRVRVTINGSTVDKADIYWVRLGLAYLVAGEGLNPVEWNVGNQTMFAKNGKYTAEASGTPFALNDVWELGVRVQALGAMRCGVYARGGYYTDTEATPPVGSEDNGSSWNLAYNEVVDGVKVAIKGSNGVTDIQSQSFATASVTSSVSMAGSVVYTIDKNSVSNNAKIVVRRRNGNTYEEVAIVGDNASDNTVDEELTVNYQFGTPGFIVSNVSLMGNTVKAVGNDKVVYIKVVDMLTGKAAASKKVKITLTTDNTNAFIKDGYRIETEGIENSGTVGTDCKAAYVKTNDAGIAKVTIHKPDAGRVNVNAVVMSGDTNNMVSADEANRLNLVYEWKDAPTSDWFGLEAQGYSYDNNKITLKFNKEILASSLSTDMFEVWMNPSANSVDDLDASSAAGEDTGTYTKSIESVTVDSSDKTKVIITFKNNPFANLKDEAVIGVAIKKSVEGTGDNLGIVYQLTTVDGEVLEADSVTAIAFQKKNDTVKVYKEATPGTTIDLTNASTATDINAEETPVE